MLSLLSLLKVICLLFCCACVSPSSSQSTATSTSSDWIHPRAPDYVFLETGVQEHSYYHWTANPIAQVFVRDELSNKRGWKEAAGVSQSELSKGKMHLMWGYITEFSVFRTYTCISYPLALIHRMYVNQLQPNPACRNDADVEQSTADDIQYAL